MASVSHSLGTVIGSVDGRRCRFFALGCLGLGPGVDLYEWENEIVGGGIFLFVWHDLNNLIASRLGVLILAGIWGKRNQYTTLAPYTIPSKVP
jgi:hypothetical protein